MSMVKFAHCVARPLEGASLQEHLLEVAKKSGSMDGLFVERLSFLAGLCHDVGKARTSWQKYITGGTKKRGEVFHSPLGSSFFTFCADCLFKRERPRGDEEQEFISTMLSLALDIAGHHGRLKDLKDDPPWSCHSIENQIEEVDLKGLFHFIKSYVPQLEDLREDTFPRWLDESKYCWESLVFQFKCNQQRELDMDRERIIAPRYCSRKLTGRLISSDRYHAAGLFGDYLEHREAEKAILVLKKACERRKEEFIVNKGAADYILNTRQEAQEEAVWAYQSQSNDPYYKLILPTGLGKTITSLRIGLEAFKRGTYSRIIYVAPYLAILSQAASEIESVTGLEVMQHHHLSLLDQENIDDIGFLSMESWQAPVVATTFNQFFLALFPRTAQQTVRLRGLYDSFIIIDEPQIINHQVWYVFLKMLRQAVEDYRLQVLFVSATMPLMKEGLGCEPLSLVPSVSFSIPSRYQCVFQEAALDEELLAEEIISAVKEHNNVCAILNTVNDAFLVYREVEERIFSDDGIALFFVCGVMTSLQKARQIYLIREALIDQAPVIVISTQILEAGVDISFQKIYRALPIIPSIVQTSGRANRHGEGKISSIEVVPFYRHGEKDTRDYIYCCPSARSITEELLKTYKEFGEEETEELIFQYYKEMNARNPAQGLYDNLVTAAKGEWSKVAGLQPFEETVVSIDVFVPWGEEYLKDNMKSVLSSFGYSIDELYDKYLEPGYLQSLDFLDRKKFMSLLTAFTIPLYPKDARRLVDIKQGKEITRLKDDSLFSEKTGLVHHFSGIDLSNRMI